jgi:hypothetical protein
MAVGRFADVQAGRRVESIGRVPAGVQALEFHEWSGIAAPAAKAR